MSCKDCIFLHNCSVEDKANCTNFDDGADYYDAMAQKEEDWRMSEAYLSEDRNLARRGGYGL